MTASVEPIKCRDWTRVEQGPYPVPTIYNFYTKETLSCIYIFELYDTVACPQCNIGAPSSWSSFDVIGGLEQDFLLVSREINLYICIQVCKLICCQIDLRFVGNCLRQTPVKSRSRSPYHQYKNFTIYSAINVDIREHEQFIMQNSKALAGNCPKLTGCILVMTPL